MHGAKIVHVASSAQLGGAEWVILDILGGLRRARPAWSLALVVPRAGPLADRAASLGVEVVVLEWGVALERVGDALAGRRNYVRLAAGMIRAVPAAIAYRWKLRRTLRALHATVVHAHGFKMQVLSLLARPVHSPTVLHLHDYVSSRPMMRRVLRRQRMTGATGVAISESIAHDVRESLGATLPIRVIYNGIDPSRWSPDGSTVDLDRLAGLAAAPQGTVRVGLVATMARWKGHETFLRAMALLPPDSRVRGYIVGGAIYRTAGSEYTIDELEEVVRRLGLGGRVGFTGLVGDPAPAMRSLDVIVHASTRPEPFGRVIVEGMALGKAVITTATGGAAELVIAGESAVVSPPGDAGALAKRILELAADAELRGRLGRMGSARARALFSRDGMTASMIGLYESLLT